MWIICALLSALGLGFYDVMKKLSVRSNDVLTVLLLNTVFSALLMSPVLVSHLLAGTSGLEASAWGHWLIMLKSLIVLASWLLGYFAIKHLPLTIQGPVNATRPVMVLAGAVIIFGERLNWLQWAGIILGFTSLYLISRIGKREGFSPRQSPWLIFAIAAALFGAMSALYDKYLLRTFTPLDVQAWYSFYQCLIMGSAITLMRRFTQRNGATTKFTWRWSILFISLFLTAADLLYFHALSLPGSMISIVSMIRRGSVIVPFLYGVIILHERNVRAKLIDLSILIVSLLLLVAGSAM